MIIRGRIRGNGAQLASYLLTKGDNETVRVFDIRGSSQPHDLRKSLIEMSLTAELSGRTKKGLYHVQINPRPGEDRKMSDADWCRAAEILEQARGFTGQKRIMVLHEKKGRLHMHVAWERYDHSRERMISNKHSRFDQDRARKSMELEFAHLRTPDRNQERPEMRKLLSKIWQEYPEGRDFMAALAGQGYTLARSDDRRPYALVNQVGRSFDLDRELKDATVRQIKARLHGLLLPDKKKTISAIQSKLKLRQADRSLSEKEQKVLELKLKLQRDQDQERSRGR